MRKILSKKFVKKVYKKLLKQVNIRVDYRPLSKKYREKPIEIYAFIRVKNEIKTIEACLNSILPVIKKGVIGYNKFHDEVDDGTEEFILEFCKKNKGFIPFRYEYDVVPANDLRYENLDNIPIESRLDTYYNAVLELIPDDVWMMKVDCDQIFNTERLSKLRYIPKNDNDVINLSKMNFHYQNDELYLMNIHTLGVGDWFLIKNRNLTHTFKSGYREDGTLFAWEVFDMSGAGELNYFYTDLFAWHFPFVKTTRDLDSKYFTKFDDFTLTNKQRKEYGVSDDMLDKEKILNICRSFK